MHRFNTSAVRNTPSLQKTVSETGSFVATTIERPVIVSARISSSWYFLFAQNFVYIKCISLFWLSVQINLPAFFLMYACLRTKQENHVTVANNEFYKFSWAALRHFQVNPNTNTKLLVTNLIASLGAFSVWYTDVHFSKFIVSFVKFTNPNKMKKNDKFQWFISAQLCYTLRAVPCLCARVA